MLKSSARSMIRLKGVRHNNLKNFDLDLPLNQLIVITGLSGSGKSSLAFDTLFAEGQRRYIETFSPYARQFFDRMDKPKVDSIEGIPPAIAIEQRNAVKTTRSTVGTMTEICDYMKMLWLHIAQLHCRQCGQLVRKDSPQTLWNALASSGAELIVTFDLPLTEKLSLQESLALISKQGYQRLLLDGEIVRLEALLSPAAPNSRGGLAITSLTVIQDRLKPAPSTRARFIEACEQAYHFGKGKLAIRELSSNLPGPKAGIQSAKLFSNRLHCAQCDIEYREPSPALFSFNHPLGACPACRGFGRVISIDYNLALPDRSKTLSQGVVKPWLTGQGADCQTDLLKTCRRFEVPTNVPFEKLPKKWQNFVINGEPGYGKDEAHEWPRAWYGVKGYFRWLESRAYKMHVRVLLSRYRAYTPCPDCNGKRFQPETLLYHVRGNGRGQNPGALEAQQDANGHDLTLADFYEMPVRDALHFVSRLATSSRLRPNDPLGLVLNEVRSRLGYLDQVGLGYLTLDRPTRSLSGGETERVNLTTCLGTCLVNTLFVLDEPSVGLHPRDTERLVNILQRLRDAGNTVVVVEHEASVMRAANQIVDLGPGHGASGGHVVFQGTFAQLKNSNLSLTGQYLSGRKAIEPQDPRPVLAPKVRNRSTYLQPLEPSLMLNDRPIFPHISRSAGDPSLRLSRASLHNLKDLTVEIPLARFVCVTGVSGSGKTTLVREVLLPALSERLKSAATDRETSDHDSADNDGDQDQGEALGLPNSATIQGWESLGGVVLVDQSILGKTPRSNPAVYIGAFEDIREFFAQSELAKQRGLNASAFSFNSAQGQCQRCRGAGFEKIEMQFLSDVFIRCPDCNGRRYRSHILEVRISPTSRAGRSAQRASRSLSIADLLDATIEEAADFLAAFPGSRPAHRARAGLALLQEVGLGYLRLGQPINTLSGGESQRLKLVRHLAKVTAARADGSVPPANHDRKPLERSPSEQADDKPILFLFDEPTTGLHFDDVRVLLKVFQRFVGAGHSVLVIEHNLDVIKCADWIIDLGPDAGDQGGEVVAEGPPKHIADCLRSHTGAALRQVLESNNRKAVACCGR